MLSANVEQYLIELGGVIDTLQIEKTRSKDQAISNMNDNLSGTSSTLTIVTVLAVTVISSLGFLLYRQIILPIGEMELKMTEIAQSHDYTHRVPVHRMDEIGRSITAFNAMIEQIQVSSELIKQKTADINAMLQNIPQGILTLEHGSTIHNEYSDYLETVLETDRIGDLNVMDVVFAQTNLGSDLLSQIDATISACIGEDLMNFEFNMHLLPTEIEKTMPNSSVKILELGWSPIANENEVVDRLMLCIRDVTELKALAKAADAQKRELAIIGEILSVRQEKFDEFVTNALNFIDENEKLIHESGEAPEPHKRQDLIRLLFRNMHTIKGNARTYGLSNMTNVVHECEQTYDDLRHHPEMEWPHGRLLEELTLTREVLNEYAQINEHKLGRKTTGITGALDKFVNIGKDQINHVIHLLDSATTSGTDALVVTMQKVRSHLALIGTEKIEDTLSGLMKSLPSLAKELGKAQPKCSIHHHQIVVTSPASEMLKNVFMHLYRNSMDHGIETPDVRVAQGKPEGGHIELSLSLNQDHLTLTLHDDGRGLAIDKIAAKAREAGLMGEASASPQEIAQLIFKSGFSTADKVTEVSGRGVGMDAVRGFVQAEGGDIKIEVGQPTQEPGFFSFKTVITLPAKFGVKALA
jgi:signal transduction histidine kinase